MKKTLALGMLTILSLGVLAGAAEARCPDRYDRARAVKWRHQRVVKVPAHRGVRAWERARFVPPGQRRDYRTISYNNRRWW